MKTLSGNREFMRKEHEREMNQKIETLAFRYWHMNYAPFDVDRIDRRSNWLRSARKGLLKTIKAVGEKAGLSPQGYWALEQREITGDITLNDMLKAADALDCEFVYYLRLKSGETFARTIWQKIYPVAIQHPKVLAAMKYGAVIAAKALATRAIRLFRDRKFRKEHGWSYLKSTHYNHAQRKTKRKKDPWAFPKKVRWRPPEPEPNPRSRGR